MAKTIVYEPIEDILEPNIRIRICELCHIPFSYAVIGSGRDRKYCSLCAKEKEKIDHRYRMRRERDKLKAEYGHAEKFVHRIRQDAKNLEVSDYDEAFEHWFSGFFDGEGYFRLRPAKQFSNKRWSYGFSLGIKLRADDYEIINKIQQYFGCGNIAIREDKSGGVNRHTQVVWVVERKAPLYHIFIPHFEKHPLRSKKQLHFEVWKEGVKLAYLNEHKTPEGRKKWNCLVNQLKEVREFKPITME